VYAFHDKDMDLWLYESRCGGRAIIYLAYVGQGADVTEATKTARDEPMNKRFYCRQSPASGVRHVQWIGTLSLFSPVIYRRAF